MHDFASGIYVVGKQYSNPSSLRMMELPSTRPQSMGTWSFDDMHPGIEMVDFKIDPNQNLLITVFQRENAG